MNKKLYFITLAASALISVYAAPEKFNDNLMVQTVFKPVIVDNEAVAAQGWFVCDYGRESFLKGPEYVDGRRCFKLEFDGKGAMTIRFSQKGAVPDVYWGKRFAMRARGGWGHNCMEPMVLAPKYHAVFEVRTNMGVIDLPGRKRVKASKEWQKLDYIIDSPRLTGGGTISFSQNPGQVMEFRKTYLAPWYPKVGGSINLPDGGKLTKFIVAKDADYKIRFGAMIWRGWFWKLTGIALPIEVRAKAVPEKGAFLITKGDAAKGGYKLEINKNGVVLTVRDSRDAYASVCNYIRNHGVRLYSLDTKIIPVPDPNMTLVKMNQNLVPKFIKLPMGKEESLNGGAEFGDLSSEVDWYDYHRYVVAHEWCNQLVPMYYYEKDHPEYYMMQKDGTRRKTANPFLMTTCLTHPDVLKIAARRFPQYMLANEHTDYTSICLGDVPICCQCPSCKKLNDGESAANSFMAFLNHLSVSLRKADPKADHPLLYSGYHLYRFPPTKVKPGPGIQVSYCIQPRTMPCQLHVDCEINRRSNADYRKWSELVGKDNLGVTIYEDVRPYHDARVFEYFTKYGRLSYKFHSFSAACIQYVVARYRFGDDPVKATEEFMDAYYGGGSEQMKTIFRKLDQFCLNYKHTEQDKREFCVAVLPCRVIAWKTVLTREFFDSVYPLFDQALKSAGNNKITRSHILYERYRFLMADLPKYPRSVCTNEKELKAFSCRLACLMNTLIELDQIQAKNPLDSNRVRKNRNCLLNDCAEKPYLLAVSGLVIPQPQGKAKWHECQVIRDFLKDPENYFIGKSGVKIIPGGYEWDAMAMFGGEGPSASGNVVSRCLRRPASGKGNISIALNLKQVPKNTCRLILTGMDDDKPGAATFQVVVNGKKVFEGANTFSEKAWTPMGIDIPAGSLKAGDNKIEIINTMKELPSDRKKLPQTGIDYGDAYEVNYFRGWIIFSTIRLMDISGEFAKFVEGKKSPLWERTNNKNYYNPKGTLKPEKGKLHLATDKMRVRAGIQQKLQYQYAVHPGEKVRISVLIAGKGKFQLNAQGWDAAKKYNRQAPVIQMAVPAQEKWVSWNLVIPKNTYYILPGILATAGSDFTVADFKMETVKGK